ncbi:helix-turn-helix transcriptional regulator [Longibacter sp.]|uniref:helix-turn-helix transcriptional regulator n=1 Tax=Longibacter sp. TaxID=2045415 RepID=UPI003EC0CBB7
MTSSERWPALLTQLDGSSWQRAIDLARRLGVSERTVYRDVQQLTEMGVPIQGVPGNGYRLPSSYLLDPVTLSVDEAIMLVLGSAYAAQNFEGKYHASARSVGRKLRDHLPDEAAQRAFSLRGSVHLVPPSVFGNPAEETLLRTIRRALLEERVVRCSRTTEDGPVIDRLRPFGLVRQNATWSVVGERIRDSSPTRSRRVVSLRVDRMQHVEMTEESFERPSGYHSTSDRNPTTRERVIRVVFSAEVAPLVHVGPSMRVEETERTGNGRLVMTLRVFHELEVMPWLLSWGSHVRVLSPQALSERIADEARKVLGQYDDVPTLLDQPEAGTPSPESVA